MSVRTDIYPREQYESVVVWASQGAGKSQHREAIGQFFGLKNWMDDPSRSELLRVEPNTLYLTSIPPNELTVGSAETDVLVIDLERVLRAIKAKEVVGGPKAGPTGPTGSIMPLPQAGVPGTVNDTNPKDAVSGKKPRWFSYIPVRVLIGLGLAMYEGTRKYGRHNYRISGVRASVYVDAAVCGHLQSFWEGQDIDPDSGLHHLDKAMASIAVLRDAIYEGNWVDDRPPRVKDYDAMMKQAEDLWLEIQKRHPDAVPPWTQKRVDQETAPQE